MFDVSSKLKINRMLRMRSWYSFISFKGGKNNMWKLSF